MQDHTSTQTATGNAFARWLRGMHSPAHARRTAARNAAFFLSNLRPGMKLLDIGCGPGSITIGLAEAIAPGEAIGVDLSADAIEEARALAAERACKNIRFEVADATRLRFADATFDAAFTHAVLQHLPDPVVALKEVRRVLKPNAVIGVADADHDGSILAPADPLLEASLRLLADLRARGGGGDPRVGKYLRSLLVDAGFSRNAASVIADCDGTGETTARSGEFWARYIESPELRHRAVAENLATDDEITAMATAWRRWAADPAAFWARFWCQAVGWADADVRS